jgi:carbonic anhydrase
MEFFTDEVMRDLLASILQTSELGSDGFRYVERGPGPAEANYIERLTIADGQRFGRGIA